MNYSVIVSDTVAGQDISRCLGKMIVPVCRKVLSDARCFIMITVDYRPITRSFWLSANGIKLHQRESAEEIASIFNAASLADDAYKITCIGTRGVVFGTTSKDDAVLALETMKNYGMVGVVSRFNRIVADHNGVYDEAAFFNIERK